MGKGKFCGRGMREMKEKMRRGSRRLEGKRKVLRKNEIDKPKGRSEKKIKSIIVKLRMVFLIT